MTVHRTLTLRRERLTELTPVELAAVAGGATLPGCATTRCAVSNIVGSLCGCVTGYCSFDAC